MNKSNLSPSAFPVPQLRIVKKQERLREYIDAKRNYFPVKRFFDILISLFVLVFVLSWMVPLMILLISLDSPGPVFFLQRRIGRGGRSFLCYKFRTMIINAEKDERPAEKNDTRITKLGKILRFSNIDELPQFINVLTGSMSIVGPRPHMYSDCRRFSSLLPEYKLRNLVKPGLTGLAQVKGYQGPALTDQSIRLRFRWDKQYIKDISFLLDSRIILQTIFQRLVEFICYPFKQLTLSKRQVFKA